MVAFLVQIALIVTLSIMGILAFRNQIVQFDAYGDMAKDAKLIDNLSAEVVKTQLAQRNYFRTSADDEKAVFLKQYKDVSALMEQAQSTIQHPERARHLDQIAKALSDYKSGFDEIANLIDQRNTLVYKDLGVKGLTMRENLTRIRSGAFSAGDYESGKFCRNCAGASAARTSLCDEIPLMTIAMKPRSEQPTSCSLSARLCQTFTILLSIRKGKLFRKKPQLSLRNIRQHRKNWSM